MATATEQTEKQNVLEDHFYWNFGNRLFMIQN